MKQWYKVIDVDLCHDCNNCFMADKDEFVDNDWPGYTAAQPRHGQRWVDILRRERGQYARNDVSYLPVPASTARTPPCVDRRRALSPAEDGIVIIDPEKAKGNRDRRYLPLRRHLVERRAAVRPEVHLLRAPARRPHLDAAHHPVRARLPHRRHEDLLRRAGRDGEDDRGRGPGGVPAGTRHQAQHPVQEPVQVHQELHHRRRAGRW